MPGSLARRVRASIQIHAVREIVIGHGWHERGVLGALLRRIDRYPP